MTYYLYDVAKSLGFGIRNGDKALNNGSDSGVRGIVGAIQTAKAGTSIFAEINKYDKFAKVAQNTANYASKYVNPLLCVASIARIAASKDKPSATIEESCAMGSMFGVEAIMKSQFKAGSILAESKLVKTGIEKLSKFLQKTPILKNLSTTTVGSVLTGLLFIAGSITAYTVGHNIGKKIADKTTRKYSFINTIPATQTA